jgi:hypothetical protein
MVGAFVLIRVRDDPRSSVGTSIQDTARQDLGVNYRINNFKNNN